MHCATWYEQRWARVGAIREAIAAYATQLGFNYVFAVGSSHTVLPPHTHAHTHTRVRRRARTHAPLAARSRPCTRPTEWPALRMGGGRPYPGGVRPLGHRDTAERSAMHDHRRGARYTHRLAHTDTFFDLYAVMVFSLRFDTTVYAITAHTDEEESLLAFDPANEQGPPPLSPCTMDQDLAGLTITVTWDMGTHFGGLFTSEHRPRIIAHAMDGCTCTHWWQKWVHSPVPHPPSESEPPAAPARQPTPTRRSLCWRQPTPTTEWRWVPGNGGAEDWGATIASAKDQRTRLGPGETMVIDLAALGSRPPQPGKEYKPFAVTINMSQQHPDGSMRYPGAGVSADSAWLFSVYSKALHGRHEVLARPVAGAPTKAVYTMVLAGQYAKGKAPLPLSSPARELPRELAQTLQRQGLSELPHLIEERFGYNRGIIPLQERPARGQRAADGGAGQPDPAQAAGGHEIERTIGEGKVESALLANIRSLKRQLDDGGRDEALQEAALRQGGGRPEHGKAQPGGGEGGHEGSGRSDKERQQGIYRLEATWAPWCSLRNQESAHGLEGEGHRG